jgi:ORF6N domain
MLSFDLAELYGVEPKSLVQAVKRNIDRFPEDFMFQLSNEEFGAGSGGPTHMLSPSRAWLCSRAHFAANGLST